MRLQSLSVDILSVSVCEMNLNIFHVDEDVRRKKVPQLFDRTEKSVDEDVVIIKNWIKTQHHFPETLGDVQIRNFLVLNKFSIERTKQKIDMYYTIRSLIPDFFDNANPKSKALIRLMETAYCFVHPKAYDGMYRVYFTKVKSRDQLAPLEMLLQIFNIFEMRLHEDCMVGDIFIVDMGNITFNDVKKLTPMVLHKAFTIYEKVYSFRLKALHFLNSPPYISVLMTVLKSLMKAKLFDRFHVHQDDEIIRELLDKDMVPEDYGGEGLSLDKLQELMKLKLAQYEDRFDKLDKLRVDESMRPAKLHNDEYLGFHGNFKKLDID